MFKILEKNILAPLVKKLEIQTPEIAAKALPGQFVILRLDEYGERIPLTVAGKNIQRGTITLIFQEVGKTTKKLGRLKAGDEILDLVGPLGHPTKIKKYGLVICIGGGVGVAEVLPVAKALGEIGNRVFGIIGARTKEMVILEREMGEVCDRLYVITDDGTSGEKGFVTDILKKILTSHQSPVTQSPRYPDLVYAIGPVPMMRAVSEGTRPYQIKTLVSLNPIMLDGTGMCGTCRVKIGEETKFACLDGPEFDGHLVNWDELSQRQKIYLEEEKIANGEKNSTKKNTNSPSTC